VTSSAGSSKQAAKAASAGKGARLVPASLAALDALDVDTLLLIITEDERPLQGAAGLLDWRMCGWITQQLLTQNLTGKRGDRYLTWTAGRLPVPRVIILGAGPSNAVVDALPRLLGDVATIVDKAGCQSVAMAASCSGAALQKALADAPALLQDRVKTVLDAAD